MAETIFILGAGASMPYGFPSGEKLKTQIQEVLGELIRELPIVRRKTSALSEILKASNRVEASFCREFQETLVRSGVYSIDAFLERRPKFRELGKMIIAYLLLRSERNCLDQNTLFLPEKPEENWYRYFFNEIKDIKQFNFKIYTFNYERSLEYYFIEAYRNLFDYSSEVIFDRIKAMNIIHLHGSLGSVNSPLKVANPNFGDTFRINCYDDLENLSQGIDIIYEVQGTKFEALRKDLVFASNIVFIGFGFDKINMRNIGLSDIKLYEDNQMIWASTYNLSQNEVFDRLYSKIRPIRRTQEGEMLGELKNMVLTSNETAASFLKNALPHQVYNC